MKKLIEIIIIALFSGFLFLVGGIFLFYSLFGIKDKSTAFLTQELHTDSLSFKNIAMNILSDTTLNYISIQGGNSNRCEAVNKWVRCPGRGGWINNQSELASLQEVLQVENIERKYYETIITFMNKHKIKSIGISFNCNTCVDFEASYNGLRYSKKNNLNFQPDFEYLIVNKINANWFSYERDIN